jgi:pimeloyl-ACP methyl ester carboxylesterase
MFRPLTRLPAVFVVVCASLAFVTAGPARAELKVDWTRGASSPGTPPRYDRVGVIKVGSPHAPNVLVLEPGTSAGAAYFVPLARWIVARAPKWQVWSVERRENLLEDQSVLDLAKEGLATSTQLFNYYLGWLDPALQVQSHIQLIPSSSVRFAKRWGMTVAVGDLRHVIDAARRLGGKVVLGGHSLGGAVVTAYATWNFHGRAGARNLAGLVYIDGGSLPAISAATARSELRGLDSSGTSPWLTFGGIPAPFAGLFSATGATAAVIDPESASPGQSSGLLSAFHLSPSVPVTNLAQFGYALNVGTSPMSLLAAQAHLGRGISPIGPLHGWDGAGALTPITRFATMFSGLGVAGADGTEWYFPERLTIDSGAVGNGLAGPAQRVLGVEATMGRELPKRLLIYAFGARLGGAGVLTDARTLAAESGIPKSNLLLINRQSTYAHNDPAGAYPRNAFFAGLMRFLGRVTRQR